MTPSREAARSHSRGRRQSDAGCGPVRLLATGYHRLVARLRLVAEAQAGSTDAQDAKAVVSELPDFRAGWRATRRGQDLRGRGREDSTVGAPMVTRCYVDLTRSTRACGCRVPRHECPPSSLTASSTRLVGSRSYHVESASAHCRIRRAATWLLWRVLSACGLQGSRFDMAATKTSGGTRYS